ncbi:hypothetical protein [Rubricoccus marinus]|uniref:Cyclic nucleotide-binding domain-containing protein n=1 Tax=Rubricoccus marinus TaxID=716817 RepID=A0A259TX09_9BACT|nr:hypothetical protein [Rubricoccus marinus]OZC02251.1 hypothetical protein BSZ36_04155 [Rubricoccus marinus]
MSRLRLLGIAFLASGALTACDSGADLADGEIQSIETVSVVDSSGVVGDRYRALGPDGIAFTPEASVSAKGARVALAPLYNVAAPAGTHATHLALDGDKVTGSYLVPGNPFGGGYDLIDPGAPGQSSAFTASYLDLAGVYHRDDDLFLSGSLDLTHPETQSLRFESLAVFARVDTRRNKTKMVELGSDFVMDVVYPESGNDFFAVTGYDGGLYRIQRSSLNARLIGMATDLRSVVVAGDDADDLLVLDGAGNVRPASIRSGIGEPVHTVRPFLHGAIAKMHASGGRVYVPNGNEGFDVLDASGAFLTYFKSGAVKSVATSGDLVAVANADDGVLMARWTTGEDGKPALERLGRLDFGDAQVNHVLIHGSTVYVAAGASGVYAVQVSF